MLYHAYSNHKMSRDTVIISEIETLKQNVTKNRYNFFRMCTIISFLTYIVATKYIKQNMTELNGEIVTLTIITERRISYIQ